MRAALIPDVALVELPPKKSADEVIHQPETPSRTGPCTYARTILVEEENVATSQVDGVCSTEPGHWYMVNNALQSSINPRACLHPPPTTMTLGAMKEAVSISARGVG